MAVFIKDSFDGTSGANISSRSPTGTGAAGSWTDVSGNAAIQLNGTGAVNFTNGSDNFYTCSVAADCYVQTTAGASFESFSYPLLFRYSNAANWWAFRFASGQYQLVKNAADSVSVVSAGPGSFSVGDIFKVEASASSITCYKNGTSILSVTDSHNSLALYCGILCRASALNDVMRDFEAGSFTAYTYSRPTSDITTQWTPSTGIDHFALIDETTANDSDYIYATAAGQTDEVKLAAMAAPKSGTDLKVNYRVQGITDGGNVTVTLVLGGAVIKTDTTRLVDGDYSMDVTPTDYAGVTDWTDVALRFVS